jgi:hypothetical protein
MSTETAIALMADLLAPVLYHCLRSIADGNAAGVNAAAADLERFLAMWRVTGASTTAPVLRRAVGHFQLPPSASPQERAVDAAARAGLSLLIARTVQAPGASARILERQRAFLAAAAGLATAAAPATAPDPDPDPDPRQARGYAALLRTKTIADTVTFWRNALLVLADQARRADHASAQAMVEAVEREWTRRRKEPPSAGDRFAWPSTEARPGSSGLDSEAWLKHGLLQFIGYKVGATQGEPRDMRVRMLNQIFVGHLPPAFPADYLAEWGRPKSADRLRKLANTIAALTRNAKRRGSDRMGAAIADWEHDLRFLHARYYVGHFHFDWPATDT